LCLYSILIAGASQVQQTFPKVMGITAKNV